MANFTLTDIEEAQAKEFRKFIKKEFGERHLKRTYFQYIFTPNGIGVEVEIRDKESGETWNITDMSNW